MATYVPGDFDYSEVGKSIGKGLSKTYQKYADDKALQKAVDDVEKDPNKVPSAEDIVRAIAKTKTHSNESKKEWIENIIGGEKLSQAKRKIDKDFEIDQARNSIAQKKEENAAAKINQKEQQEKNRVTEKKQDEATKKEEKKLEETAKKEEKKNEEIKKREQTKAIVGQLGLSPEETESLGEGLSLGAAEGLLKQKMKPMKGEQGKLSPFEKKIQEENAQDYIDTTKEIPLLKDNVATIEEVRGIAKQLGPFGINSLGPLSGLVGTEKATELEAKSFPLMAPIIKVFNPVGAIPVRKMELIANKFQVKASDYPWQIEGKLRALELFSQQALTRAEQKIALYQKYNGNPPISEVESFNRASETTANVMADYPVYGEPVEIPGLPAPKGYQDKKIRGPDGTIYYSDGVRWIRK